MFPSLDFWYREKDSLVLEAFEILSEIKCFIGIPEGKDFRYTHTKSDLLKEPISLLILLSTALSVLVKRLCGLHEDTVQIFP